MSFWLFKQTQKTIDFVNQNHEMFQVLVMEGLYQKRYSFDKIVYVEHGSSVDIFVYINSTKAVPIDWSLKDIVLKY